jgi:catalase
VKAYDTSEEDYSAQAGNLFRLMDDEQKRQLTHDIAEGLIRASESVQQRILEQFTKADPEYAVRVSQAISEMIS